MLFERALYACTLGHISKCGPQWLANKPRAVNLDALMEKRSLECLILPESGRWRTYINNNDEVDASDVRYNNCAAIATVLHVMPLCDVTPLDKNASETGLS